MKKAFTIATLALLAAAVVFTGCKSLKGDENRPIEPRPEQVSSAIQLNDIPAPDGFMFSENDSHVIQAGALRPASKLVYSAPQRSIVEVAEFYLATMPGLGWTPIGQNVVADRAILIFENAYEISSVHISNDSNKKTTVIIGIDCK